MKVTIPEREKHQGLYALTVEISDTCPKCGGPRGVPYPTVSYDGSRRLNVEGWENPCGHIDSYDAIRQEVKEEREKRLSALSNHQREMLTEASILIENVALQVEDLCKWSGFPLVGLPQWEAYNIAWGSLQAVLDYWKSE